MHVASGVTPSQSAADAPTRAAKGAAVDAANLAPAAASACQGSVSGASAS
jgi:hypothetical protein